MKTKKADKGNRKPLIAQFYRGNKIAFALASLSALLIGSLNLIISWLSQQLLDAISAEPSALPLFTLTILTAGVVVLIVLFKLLSYVSMPRFLEKAMRQYKDFAFAKLTQKSIASFNDESTAMYISALSNDCASIEINYLDKQFDFISSAIMFVGAFTMMIIYNPLLTAVAVALSILPVIASVLAGDRLEKAEKQISDRNEGFMASLKDSLSGFSVVKSFKAEKAVFDLFSKSNHVETVVLMSRKEK